jgi:methionine sulfoxide reductase heme-binding subunit
VSISQAVNGRLRKVPVWPLYILGALPGVWLFYSAVSGMSGPDPIRPLERGLGLYGLQFLIAGLAVTPLRKYAGVNLIKVRRAIGLVAFFYIVVHLAVWIGLDMGLRWGQMWADILKRPYITIGMVGFVAMVPLAVTSNNRSVRKLGAGLWQRIHKLTYFVVAAGVVHFVMVQKVWEAEPLIYSAVVLGLLATRLKWPPRRVVARP